MKNFTIEDIILNKNYVLVKIKEDKEIIRRKWLKSYALWKLQQIYYPIKLFFQPGISKEIVQDFIRKIDKFAIWNYNKNINSITFTSTDPF